MDSKESKLECPEQKDQIRTHITFGMHKFEIIKREVETDPDEMKFGGNQTEPCVQLTMLF